MKDERLYIDGQLVDIDDNTKITLDIKSNLFRDVSKMTSNNTYTVKLPKTVRNQMLLKHVDLVQSNDTYAYVMHRARYFRNGVEVIKDGRATILAVTDEAIEISIVWGLFPNFSSLISNGTQLNQLESTDRIKFTSANNVDDYESTLASNYFYADYDFEKHSNTVDYTWRAGGGMIYPEANSWTDTTISYGGFRGGHTTSAKGYLHPVVRVPYVLSLIKSNVGVDFQFTGSAKEYIDTLIIPLISKKANELTFDNYFEATIGALSDAGATTLTVKTASNVFSQDVGDAVTELSVASDATLVMDISAEWSFDLTGSTPRGHTTRSVGGVTVSYDNYSFSGGYYLKLTVKNNVETNEYIMGSNRIPFSVIVPSGYKGVVRYRYTGYGKIEVKAGQKVTLEWVKIAGLNGATFYGGTMKATLQSDENVPSGGYFPIAINLPKIKIIDFVKFLAAITGTLPLQMSQDGIVKFVPLSTVWENKSQAKDWTRRLIAQGNENKPKNIDFTMDGYGQHNLYKWKADDTVVGNYDGDMTISNETLETEKTIIEFPFAATDGSNVPMYESESSSSSSSTTTTTETTEPSYSACKDRILREFKGDDGKALAKFDINMQEILDEKYRNVAESLQKAKIVKEKIRIRDLELIDFDETKPIYLAQYASYFAVTEIKADETGLAEVTMLQLYFDD